MFDRTFRRIRMIYPPKPGEDPHDWRVNVFFCLAALLLVMALTLFVGSGVFHKAGLHGVAWAEDVDKKIADAVTSIEEKIADTDVKVTASAKTNKAILRALYLPQIRAKVRERCDTNDFDERAEINVELDRIRAEYKHLSGEDFGPNPTCSEV